MWIGKAFRLREKLRAIGHLSTVEYLPAGEIVLVTSEKAMQVVTVRARGRSFTVFADALEASGEEVDGSEYTG